MEKLERILAIRMAAPSMRRQIVRTSLHHLYACCDQASPLRLRSRQEPALRLLGGFAFQGTLEGLVQGGFGFFVFLLGNLALLVFDLEIEEFFF